MYRYEREALEKKNIERMGVPIEQLEKKNKTNDKRYIALMSSISLIIVLAGTFLVVKQARSIR